MTQKKFNELPEQWLEMREIPFGGLFRLSNSESAPVWVRWDYYRSDGTYVCHKYDDVNHESSFTPTRRVWVGFEF